ncbi:MULTISPECIES: YhcB family protein [Chromohalobacter]|uniref:Z-ring associated protein G n=1 Tax=Chromohalobacter beijerinckii TaxID=86179 RepID=A0ABV8XBG0_9GAMM|nr:YhcB family protein [Chromohalobacter japonicus]MCK0765098.1 YhcB family protein [Chromohalobacter beijerinckii]
MNESNIDWILAIACFLAGIGIGALGYHLLNANVARNQKVRQRLAEAELELSQVKDALNDHFAKASELVTSIQRQSHELEQQLSQGADRLVDDLQLKRRLHPRQEGETQEEDADSPQMPRDYAEGTQGTLSENYGLQPRKQRVTEEETTPPRY